jgi:hypothetical protein
MKKIIIATLLLLLTAAMAWAAGTVTETSSTYGYGIRKVTLAWTSDASGDATYTTSQLSGAIMRVTFDPDGTAAPTDLYDITLKDENDFDVLVGSGANLSATTSSSVCPQIDDQDGTNTIAVIISGQLSLAVSNAGNAKSGEVVLYLK